MQCKLCTGHYEYDEGANFGSIFICTGCIADYQSRLTPIADLLNTGWEILELDHSEVNGTIRVFADMKKNNTKIYVEAVDWESCFRDYDTECGACGEDPIERYDDFCGLCGEELILKTDINELLMEMMNYEQIDR